VDGWGGEGSRRLRCSQQSRPPRDAKSVTSPQPERSLAPPAHAPRLLMNRWIAAAGRCSYCSCITAACRAPRPSHPHTLARGDTTFISEHRRRSAVSCLRVTRVLQRRGPPLHPLRMTPRSSLFRRTALQWPRCSLSTEYSRRWQSFDCQGKSVQIRHGPRHCNRGRLAQGYQPPL
jgi:hypothetical protein